ncbi:MULTISPECIES: (d)CMP kinase [Metabacillus]|uniref:Cytidylate kinase n=1 Tax=Metabacillus endolithicus TaxID=1535204 RepID=A0ABW5BVV2_9BACI|nr:(d)CMP kinase [Metabacillus sp. B2-18]UGB29286.1 (d)CMP kinase [Metabacillus sp. B2-18]
MEQKKLSVAIDGPAAAGKSTVAKIIAEDYSYIYIDTGAMYRALTFKALQEGIDLKDEKAVADILSKMKIELHPSKDGQLVMINGENVSDVIRTNEVTNNVSFVAMHSLVREEMLKRQRQLAIEGGVVMDGRDIGTHVLPNAELKIFLRASVEERAKRRHEENVKKGFSSNYEQLKQEIANRDKLDSEREVAPLKKAEDAIEIDTTALSIQDVVRKIEDYLEERL